MSTSLRTLVCGLGGFVLSWILIRLILSRRIWFATGTGERQLHQTHITPIPRIGGLAFAAVYVVVGILILVWLPHRRTDPTAWAALVGGLAIFALGFYDDLFTLRARTKLLGQLLVAVGLTAAGVVIDRFKNPLSGEIYDLGWLGYPITVFWIVAMMNLINLSDGFDGLAGGIGFMVLSLLAYVGMKSGISFTVLMSVGLAGALLAFLFHNFPPAKIYMGDGGAYLIGFAIAVLAIFSSHKGEVAVAMLAPMMALALPIADVSLAILRRGLRGLPIFRPDRKHIHHRLAQLGLSPLKVVLILYGLSLLFLLMGFAVMWSGGRLMPLLAGLAVLVVALGVRYLGWVRNLFNVATLIGSVSASRRRVRYALVLAEWLEMEAELADNARTLWEQFVFCARRLDLRGVRLTAAGGELNWGAPASTAPADLEDNHDVPFAGGCRLSFSGSSQRLDRRTFQLTTELAAEAWLRALRRWRATHDRDWSVAEALGGASQPPATPAPATP
jgi:UDP-GlcNAc:undecaprenyl-phosphate GlcNAc-1-phosphate transferase